MSVLPQETQAKRSRRRQPYRLLPPLSLSICFGCLHTEWSYKPHLKIPINNKHPTWFLISTQAFPGLSSVCSPTYDFLSCYKCYVPHATVPTTFHQVCKHGLNNWSLTRAYDFCSYYKIYFIHTKLSIVICQCQTMHMNKSPVSYRSIEDTQNIPLFLPSQPPPLQLLRANHTLTFSSNNLC